jgi:hypothetical protein
LRKAGAKLVSSCLKPRCWTWCDTASDLYIYLEQELQSFGLNLVPRASVWGRGETRGSPGLGRSILHSDWLTPYCLKITELDSWQ